MSFGLTGLCLLGGGLFYCFLGVCFSICYDRYLPASKDWDGLYGCTFLFWPFFLLAMVICCVFGSINKLYRWLDL